MESLAHTMVHWGKVWIANSGDLIRMKVAQSGTRKERDASFVRVHSISL